MARTLIGRREREVGPVVRQVGRALALGRIVLGTAFVAAPAQTTAAWLGRADAADAGRAVAVRGLGARDLVLGLGTLVALRPGGDARQAARWVEAAIVADLADAASTLVAGTEDDDAPARTVSTAVALGSAVTGAVIRAGLR